MTIKPFAEVDDAFAWDEGEGKSAPEPIGSTGTGATSSAKPRRAVGRYSGAVMDLTLVFDISVEIIDFSNGCAR